MLLPWGPTAPPVIRPSFFCWGPPSDSLDKGEDMRGRVSQEEGRSGDAGGAQLGAERVSCLETTSCPGSAQAFRGNQSAPAALTTPTGNGA